MLFVDMSKDENNDPRIEGDSLAVVVEPKLKKPQLFRVVLLNDDYTPMEFVVEILETFFGLDRTRATQVMLTVHTQGKGVAGIYPKDIAETKAYNVNKYSRESQHPLLCEAEPVDTGDD